MSITGDVNQLFARQRPDVVADITAMPDTTDLTGVCAEVSSPIFYIITNRDPRDTIRVGFVVGLDDEAGRVGFVLDVDDEGFTVFAQGPNAITDEQEGTVEIYGGAYNVKLLDFGTTSFQFKTWWIDPNVILGATHAYDITASAAWMGVMADQTEDGFTTVHAGNSGGTAGYATLYDSTGSRGRDTYRVVGLDLAAGLPIMVPEEVVRTGTVNIDAVVPVPIVEIPREGERAVITITSSFESPLAGVEMQQQTISVINDGEGLSVVNGPNVIFPVGGSISRVELDEDGGDAVAAFITGDIEGEGAGAGKFRIFVHPVVYHHTEP